MPAGQMGVLKEKNDAEDFLRAIFRSTLLLALD
jgi:hypothetical protein